MLRIIFLMGVVGFVCLYPHLEGTAATRETGGLAGAQHGVEPWPLSVPILAGVFVLLALSAFFSGSETAFFSIHRLRLRSMAEQQTFADAAVTKVMSNPNRLLTTILVGNMIVNVLIGVLLGTRVEKVMGQYIETSWVAYAAAVAVTTSVLVLFGEIMPKVFAVGAGERYAKVAVFPLLLADRVLAPIRDSLTWVTNAIFRVTHFHDLSAAPFITDQEFKSALSEGEAQSVLEEEEREMIRGILEFRDVLLREIRVPRPDVVCLPADATVREALETFRDKEYSRMPVYEESLDKVAGILVAKDLIPCLGRGELDRPVRELVRPPHFVPETMTVQQYVDDARRHRSHMAIVVDEYGGTEGIVTLEDAMEEVVGDIMDEDEQEEALITQTGEDAYVVDGRLPLDELSELLGMPLEDLSHDTVAGFIMEHLDKVPDPGDRIEEFGARFTVDACEGKRVTQVRLEIVRKPVAAEDVEQRQ